MVSSPPPPFLSSFFFFSLLLFLLPAPSHCSQSPSSTPSAAIPDGPNISLHELLPQYGLPPGLFPDTVLSFFIFSNGNFIVNLAGECYVKFDYLVYYAPLITGTLRYGGVENLKGIQLRSFLIWFEVDAIKVDLPPNDYIYFQVGWISSGLEVDQFQTLHSCLADQAAADAGRLGGGVAVEDILLDS